MTIFPSLVTISIALSLSIHSLAAAGSSVDARYRHDHDHVSRDSDDACDVNIYYQSIPQLLTGQQPTSREEWVTLINQLQSLLQSTHVVVPYTSSSTDVWDALGVLDQDPSNSSNVMLLYSNNTMPWVKQSSDGWNREHMVARSYGLFDNGPDYSDLHNLRPEDSDVNSARSNLYFDDCYPDVDPTCVMPATGEAAADTAKNSLVFMPPENKKGLIARTAFYIALRYNGSISEANTEQMVLSGCPCVATHAFGNLTTMLRWHATRQVTSSEMLRNNLTCTMYQHNRNPFVDFPWLSEMFLVQPPIDLVALGCASDYSDNPDTCSSANAGTKAPTRSPTKGSGTSPPTRSPTKGSGTSPPTSFSDSTLPVGAIAIIGANSDNPDSFLVVALIDIKKNTQIFFTDNAWTGSELKTNEGTLSFVFTQDIAAGTLWDYPASVDITFGYWNTEASFALSTDGDQILAYTGSASNPTFCYGFSFNSWVSEGTSLSSSTSVLPQSLVALNASVALTNVRNAVYDGITTGNLFQLLDNIHQSSTWIFDNSNRYSYDTSAHYDVEAISASPTISSNNFDNSGNDSYNELETKYVILIAVLASAVAVTLGILIALKYRHSCTQSEEKLSEVENITPLHH